MKEIFLLLGSNIGNPETNLSKARSLLQETLGPISVSSNIYKTDPWGFYHEKHFLNQVIKFESDILPENLLSKILAIEKSMGRIRSVTGYEGRIIDIDILFYSDRIINTPNLITPHPLLHKRKFTLFPLAEIAPKLIHPILKKSISELLQECADKGNVSLNE